MAKDSIPSAKITLSYPLYACDFDPHDANHLVVGGGGGPGRHGVGNKLTLLNTSDETELKNEAEIELSPSEDNVTTVAVGPRKDRNTLVFAGVNSSPEDVKKGKNEHFRVFGLNHPGKSAKSSGVRFSETARESLFSTTDDNAYQRLLRLSQPFDASPQLGAVATGLSNEAQVALFDVPAAGSAPAKPKGRLTLDKEAMDLDVIQIGQDAYQLAYCDDYDIFTADVTKSGISDARSVWTTEFDVATGATTRPAFRSIRYLTSGFVLAVLNNPRRTGALLHVYRLPTKEQPRARLAAARKLPKSVTQATGLAVRNLSPVSSVAEKQGQTQFVIAVVGNDCSISLFTLEHKSVGAIDLVADLLPFQVLKASHPVQVTGISFSVLNPPKAGINNPPSTLNIKLASISIGNTAVVHTIPLKKHIEKAGAVKQAGPPKPPRYVVAIKSKKDSPAEILTVTTIFILILAFIGQAFLELKGLSEPKLGIANYAPASWSRPLRVVQPAQDRFFGSLLANIDPTQHGKVVVREVDSPEGLKDGGDQMSKLSVDVHDEEAHGPAKAWDDLGEREQHLWRQRLKRTGHWVEDMGETVFKGILFGEIGGAIGNIVGEAL